MLQFVAVARTDVGRVRKRNEDAIGLFPEVALFAVADGMGGHKGGEIASEMTIESIRHSLAQTADDDLTPIVDRSGNSSLGGRRLLIAVHEANDRVRDASLRDPSLEGMGAAVAAMTFDARFGTVAICHVGDTRVYRIRDSAIEQLTEDHTVVQQLLREGRIQPDRLRTDPHRHMLTQAVGVDPLMSPGLRLESPRAGDIYVLSSDGLHDVVEEREIVDVIRSVRDDFETACSRLIELANQRGGRDNTTVMILTCRELG